MNDTIVHDSQHDYTEIFSAVKALRGAYSLGDAWRASDKAGTYLLPILNPELKVRDYIAASEAGESLVIMDDGAISPLKVMNKSLHAIFMRSSEIMNGDTQSRALVHSRIIMPGAQSLEVVCVHASHGIRPGKYFEAIGIIPERDHHFRNSLFNTGRVDQVSSWDADEILYQKISSSELHLRDKNHLLKGYLTHVAVDDTSTAKEKVDDFLRPELEHMPNLDDQIGYAVIDKKGLVTMDWFDSHATWSQLKDELYLKDGLLLASKQGLKSPKKPKGFDPAKLFADTMPASMERRVIFEDTHSTITALKGGEYTGEMTQLQDKVIHFSLSRK